MLDPACDLPYWSPEVVAVGDPCISNAFPHVPPPLPANGVGVAMSALQGTR